MNLRHYTAFMRTNGTTALMCSIGATRHLQLRRTLSAAPFFLSFLSSFFSLSVLPKTRDHLPPMAPESFFLFPSIVRQSVDICFALLLCHGSAKYYLSAPTVRCSSLNMPRIAFFFVLSDLFGHFFCLCFFPNNLCVPSVVDAPIIFHYWETHPCDARSKHSTIFGCISAPLFSNKNAAFSIITRSTTSFRIARFFSAEQKCAPSARFILNPHSRRFCIHSHFLHFSFHNLRLLNTLGHCPWCPKKSAFTKKGATSAALIYDICDWVAFYCQLSDAITLASSFFLSLKLNQLCTSGALFRLNSHFFIIFNSQMSIFLFFFALFSNKPLVTDRFPLRFRFSILFSFLDFRFVCGFAFL